MIRAKNITSIQKIPNDSDGRFLVTINHDVFPRASITVGERRGYTLLFKLLQHDVKGYKKAKADAATLDEKIAVRAAFKEKYQGMLPLVETAIRQGRLAHPGLYAGIALILSSFAFALGITSFEPHPSVQKAAEVLMDFLGSAHNKGKEALLLAGMAVGTLLGFGGAASLIGGILTSSNKTFRITEAFKDAGMELFKKKDGAAQQPQE